MTGRIAAEEHAESGGIGSHVPAGGKETGQVPDRVLARLEILFGILTAVIGAASLAGGQTSAVPSGSLFVSFFPLAVSTALIWIFYGAVLALHGTGPVPSAGRHIITGGIVIIAIVEAFEIPLNILGLESAGRAGRIAGEVAAPYLPAAPFLIILAGIALLLLVHAEVPSPRQVRDRDAAGVAGSVVAVISLFLVLGFVYAIPVFAGTPFIPVGTASAFAGLWTGAGLVCAAGPSAIPLSTSPGTPSGPRCSGRSSPSSSFSSSWTIFSIS